MCFDDVRKCLKQFESDGKGRLMFNIKFIQFDSEPDFFGRAERANPIFFGLHPKYSEGRKFLLTLDYKAVLSEKAVGQVPQERMSELAQGLGGVQKHALDWYKTSEEAKRKTDVAAAYVDMKINEQKRNETRYQFF